MLTLFFTIIFLAELIVASWIISKIKKANAVVCDYNKKLTEFQPMLKDNLQKIHEIINNIHSKLNCLTSSVSNRVENCKNLFKSKALTDLAMWVLNIPYKKILTIVEIILTIRKLTKV